MKKIMRKISLIIMIFMCATTMLGCSLAELIWQPIYDRMEDDLDEIEEGELIQREYDGFLYCFITSPTSPRGSDMGDYVAITGLTEELKKAKSIVIPEEIEGKTVTQIGLNTPDYSLSRNAQYTKIFIPDTVLCVCHTKDINGFRKTFLVDRAVELKEERRREFIKNSLSPLTNLYTIEEHLETYNTILEEEGIGHNQYITNIANLTYIVDGGVYWIDDYNDGESVLFPDAPMKNGYLFDGWYSDEDGNERFDKGNAIYQREDQQKTVTLYAKWIEIGA